MRASGPSRLEALAATGPEGARAPAGQAHHHDGSMPGPRAATKCREGFRRAEAWPPILKIVVACRLYK